MTPFLCGRWWLVLCSWSKLDVVLKNRTDFVMQLKESGHFLFPTFLLIFYFLLWSFCFAVCKGHDLKKKKKFSTYGLQTHLIACTICRWGRTTFVHSEEKMFQPLLAAFFSSLLSTVHQSVHRFMQKLLSSGPHSHYGIVSGQSCPGSHSLRKCGRWRDAACLELMSAHVLR